jgi:anti-sigma factor RsiW
MFSLSNMLCIAMIRPAATESGMSAFGACREWEFVIHAFFDGELDAAGSPACNLHLARCQRCSGELNNLKSMRKKIRRSAIGWATPVVLRNRIG